MLQHIFTGSNTRVQNNLARQTGLDTGQVAGLMAQLAPLLLGTLSQQKKQQNLDLSGISGLLGNLSGQGDIGGIMGLVTNLLDSDNDGSVADDVGGLLKGLLKK